MTKEEERETKKLVIQALEEFLNKHGYELDHKNIAPATSAYFARDHYKDDLINEVWPRK